MHQAHIETEFITELAFEVVEEAGEELPADRYHLSSGLVLQFASHGSQLVTDPAPVKQ